MTRNYLQSGMLTQEGEHIKKVGANISSSGAEAIFEILTYLMKSKFKTLSAEILETLHLKRSADQIIQDGYFASCSDYGLAFCALVRAKNIPAKFMHYLDLNQFKISPHHLSLHVFCECYIDSITLFVDPQKGLVQNIVDETDYRHLLQRNGKDYVLGYEGLDNTEVNVFSEADLLKHMIFVGNKHLEEHARTTS